MGIRCESFFDSLSWFLVEESSAVAEDQTSTDRRREGDVSFFFGVFDHLFMCKTK
jgi:hypothetical protein